MAKRIQVTTSPGEEIIRVWATRGRAQWFALIESADETYRYQGNGCGGSFGAGVDRIDAIGDIETRIYWAAKIDGHNLRPIEATSAIATEGA